jgi:toxin CptA
MPGAFRCLAGGALMGVGSAMIPGGNDNLILVGLPMAMPYAWQAIAAMILAIWAGLIVQASWRKKASTPSDRVVSG